MCVAAVKTDDACVLEKAEHHEFDQLLVAADMARLKTYMGFDWSRYNPGSTKPPFEEPYDSDTDAYVVPLGNAAALDGAVAAYDTVFVDPQLPWCDVCMAAKEHFVKAARRVHVNGEGRDRGDPPLFARVDMRENRDLAWRYNVSCHRGVLGSTSHVPCAFLVFKKGEPVTFLGQKPTDEQFFAAVLGYIGHPVRELKTLPDVTAFKESARITVLGVFTSRADPGFEALTQAAGRLRVKMPIAAVMDPAVVVELDVKPPALLLFKPTTDGTRSVWRKL